MNTDVIALLLLVACCVDGLYAQSTKKVALSTVADLKGVTCRGKGPNRIYGKFLKKEAANESSSGFDSADVVLTRLDGNREQIMATTNESGVFCIDNNFPTVGRINIQFTARARDDTRNNACVFEISAASQYIEKFVDDDGRCLPINRRRTSIPFAAQLRSSGFSKAVQKDYLIYHVTIENPDSRHFIAYGAKADLETNGPNAVKIAVSSLHYADICGPPFGVPLVRIGPFGLLSRVGSVDNGCIVHAQEFLRPGESVPPYGVLSRLIAFYKADSLKDKPEITVNVVGSFLKERVSGDRVRYPAGLMA